jgi:uncharacterized SAM-binding protein YcdF (DUF218 family)
VWLLSRSLESWYSPGPPEQAAVAAIVVLSGNVMHPTPSRPFPIASQNTYNRVVYAAWLHHRLGKVPVLASGGNPGPPHVESFAATMKSLLTAAGVRPEWIWLEEQSRSTYENAQFSAEILREKGIRSIALVTEAAHMPRAERCFRKQGLNVTPAPTGFRTFDFDLEEFVPGWSGIQYSEIALHELVGLVWYRVRGYI